MVAVKDSGGEGAFLVFASLFFGNGSGACHGGKVREKPRRVKAGALVGGVAVYSALAWRLSFLQAAIMASMSSTQRSCGLW